MLDRVSDRHGELFRKAVARYEFRVAVEGDVDGIVALWPEHWAEAHYSDRGIVPDEPRYRDWVARKIECDAGVFLLAIDAGTGQPVGFFAYTLDHNFSEKPVAVMGSFFVRKTHRRSAVPALLLELGLDLAQSEGACAFHAPITSESLSSRSLENSFRKHGFTVIGTMMGRAL
jgi:GNAT superfamily N-acetyltransferase